MSKITSDDVKEYLVSGGKFIGGLALKFYGETINKACDEAFTDAIEIGITNTIAALYDADVPTEENIRVLNKFWGISSNEAEDRILFEKSQAATRELKRYLKMQGYSKREISEFMKSNMALIKISHNKELWELRRNPEKLMKAVQELK